MNEVGKGKKTGLTKQLTDYLATLPGQQATASRLKAAFPEFKSKQINDALRKSSLVESSECAYRNPMWKLKTAKPVNEKLRQDIREWLQKMVPQTKGAIQAKFKDRATRLEIAEIVDNDSELDKIEYDEEQCFTWNAESFEPSSDLPAAAIEPSKYDFHQQLRLAPASTIAVELMERATTPVGSAEGDSAGCIHDEIANGLPEIPLESTVTGTLDANPISEDDTAKLVKPVCGTSETPLSLTDLAALARIMNGPYSPAENSAISSDVPNRRHPLWAAFDLVLARMDSESFQTQSAGWRRLADVFGIGYLAGRACQLVEVYAHGGGEKNILDAIAWVSLSIVYGRLKSQAAILEVLDTFDLAVDQCTKGKGVRHGGDSVPFYDQRWARLADLHGTGFLTGQAQKNFEESLGKEGDAQERGMVETLVWLAMAVLKGRGYPEVDNG